MTTRLREAMSCVLIVQRRGIFYNKYPKRAESKGRGELGTETDINLKQQLVYHVMGRHQVLQKGLDALAVPTSGELHVA